MKKTTLIALALVLMALLTACGQSPAADPTPTPVPEVAAVGANVQVKIVAESQSIDETFDISTEKTTLYDVLVENQEKLGAAIDADGFVTDMGGYKADGTKNEFFSISVNGETAMVGVKEIPIVEGDVYSFELTTW